MSTLLAPFAYHGLISWHGPSPRLSRTGHVASTSPFQLCQACSWPTPHVPPPAPSPLSSANNAALLPFSIPASWCVNPVQGGWVAMAAVKGWYGRGRRSHWCRAPDLSRKRGSGPGPSQCSSRSPQKASPNPALALCPHRVCFKSSHHTEKEMSYGGKMPRPFRAQAQYSRTNLKCHLGQSRSRPAKSWFIYIVGSGRRPRTPPRQGIGDG